MPVQTAEKTDTAPGDTAAAPAKTHRPAPTGGGVKAAQNERALRQLRHLCDKLGAGARLPLHGDLMQRFGVSERAILRAFGELQREGRIHRKPGLGTIVAEPSPSSRDADGHSDSDADGEGRSRAASPLALPRTVIAVARVDHSFYDHSLDVLCSYAEVGGDFTVLCKPLRSGEEPTPESLGALAADPARHRYLLFGYYMVPIARYLRDRGAQVVLIGTPPVGTTLDVPCIYGNQEFGGYLLTEHLIQMGHQRLAFLHYDGGLPQSLRWQGFQRAVREARRRGATVEDQYLHLILDDWEADPTRAADLLRRPDAPTAIMVWNDREAIRLLAILRQVGIRVPEDVSVVGYDNLPDGRTAYPPLTTVDPGVSHQLRAAVDLLSQAEETGGNERSAAAAPHSTVIIPTLLPRASTAPPRKHPVGPR